MPITVLCSIAAVVLVPDPSRAAALRAAGAVTQEPVLGEHQVVVVRDLLVEPVHGKQAQTGRLKVRVGGVDAAIISAARPEPESDPWAVVLYFDLVLSDLPELRNSSALLARQIERLTALGPVEILLATDRVVLPRLSPTRDREQLDEALAALFLAGDAEARLSTERMKLLLNGETTASQAHRAWHDERGLIEQRVDLLLSSLAARPAMGARKLLIPVGLSFDPQIERFYRGLIPGSEEQLTPTIGCQGSGPPEAPGRAEPMARAVATLGWTVLALPEVAAMDVPGPRGRNPDFVLANTPWSPLTGGFSEDRHIPQDPKQRPNQKKARSLLGQARLDLEAGELEDAAAGIRGALDELAEKESTQETRAGALRLLGDVLIEQGRLAAASRAFRLSDELSEHSDPTVERLASASAYPREPADSLAGSMSGSMVGSMMRASGLSQVSSAAELQEVLGRLGKLWRVSYQFPEPEPSEVLPLAVIGANGRPAPASRWTAAQRPGRALLALLNDPRTDRLAVGLVDSRIPGTQSFERPVARLRVQKPRRSDGQSDGQSDDQNDAFGWRTLAFGPDCNERIWVRATSLRVPEPTSTGVILEVVLPAGIETEGILVEEREGGRIGSVLLPEP